MHPICDLKHDCKIRWGAALNIPNFEIVRSDLLQVINLAIVANAHDDAERHDNQSPVLVLFNYIGTELTTKLDVGLGTSRSARVGNRIDISEVSCQVELAALLTKTCLIKFSTHLVFFNHGCAARMTSLSGKILDHCLRISTKV